MKNNGRYLYLEIVEKMNRFALLNFKIFWRGATAPLPRPHPPPRHSAPPCLARALRPLYRPSLCVIVDILRYFRPWIVVAIDLCHCMCYFDFALI